MIRRINTRLLKRVAAGLLIVIILAGVTGFFILPPIIKPIVIEKISQALHRDVGFEKISVNPYTLSVTLEKLKIAEKGATRELLLTRRASSESRRPRLRPETGCHPEGGPYRPTLSPDRPQ